MATYGDKRTTSKAAVHTVATTNITLATPGATIAGRALQSGESVLLTGQTDPIANGIYVWTGAAARLTRRDDADTAAKVANGVLVPCIDGNAIGTIWLAPSADVGTDEWEFVQATELPGPLHNLEASAAPAVGDDEADGYSTGSLWVDTTGGDAYICITAGVGAAVWKQITPEA